MESQSLSPRSPEIFGLSSLFGYSVVVLLQRTCLKSGAFRFRRGAYSSVGLRAEVPLAKTECITANDNLALAA
jgi:hypothetical protein